VYAMHKNEREVSSESPESAFGMVRVAAEKADGKAMRMTLA
jgi:hypothetical protein